MKIKFGKSLFSAFLLVSVLVTSGEGNDPNGYPFKIGEQLKYKVKYGWFTIGKGTVHIPSDTIVNGESSYRVKVVGQTAGLLGFFSNTTDRFDAIISKSEFKPIVASQNFQEGRKRDVQTNFFDFDAGKVRVEKINHEKNIVHDPKFYDLQPEAYDMLSSYLYLRSLDFAAFNPRDSVMVKVFFGKKHYDFGIEYGGTEVIKTREGKIKAHKFYVLFPVSSTFPKAKSVIVWTTMDENQLPLRAEAQLRFGHVTLDLVDYSNLKMAIARR